MSWPRTPTAQTPRFTASCAYSTWNLPDSSPLEAVLGARLHSVELALLGSHYQSISCRQQFGLVKIAHKWPSGEKTVMALS